MGVTTDFIGHVEIEPALNHAEQQYLAAFSMSRRYPRPGGPYDVPGNPAADCAEEPADIESYSAVGHGQPSLWCGWVPAMDGSCLTHDGLEKFYGATRWMEYLIDHFLAPGAFAAQSGADCFTDFTFDHVLNGVIAGCPRDTHELYLINVEDNVVTRETVWMPRQFDMFGELLPYEAETDRWRNRRRRRPHPA